MSIEEANEESARDPVKEATVNALKRVLDPLLELMFDAGVTVQEFNKIARDRAARLANIRILKETGRASQSRVAIMTGLPRGEVKKILDSRDGVIGIRADNLPARRVLAAWHDDPSFLDAAGMPAILPIFGRKRSFERLVEKHGAGLPVRAMLDELLQLNAIEQMKGQKLRALARLPISTGLSSRSIAAIGERGRDLLATLAHNVRLRSKPLFEATALVEEGDPDMVNLVRREITEQGTNFINGANSLLTRSQKKRSHPQNSAHKAKRRLGVTVFYFEDRISGEDVVRPEQAGRRKNLKRLKRAPHIAAPE